MTHLRFTRTALILALVGAVTLAASACGSSSGAGSSSTTVTINGPSSHNLTVNGPGVSDKATPTFAAGRSMDLTVRLENGSYELFCSVPSHKQLGMDTHLTVGSGGAAAGGGSTNGGGSSSSGSTASGGGWA